MFVCITHFPLDYKPRILSHLSLNISRKIPLSKNCIWFKIYSTQNPSFSLKLSVPRINFSRTKHYLSRTFLNIAIKQVYFIFSLFLGTFSHHKVSKRCELQVNFSKIYLMNIYCTVKFIIFFIKNSNLHEYKGKKTEERIKFYKVRHEKMK